MASTIDFSTYSLEELYDSSRSIDRNLYPDRAKEIDELILKKEKEKPEQQKDTNQVGEKAAKTDRLLSALIDGFIAMVAMTPIFYFFGLDAFKDPNLTLMAGTFVYGIFVTFTLNGYLMYYYGQTIGKHYMSIRIENLDGTKANLKTIYLKRMLPMQIIGLIPSVGQFISGIVNPLFIFGKQRRCLHDYLAKTKVTYTDT